VHRRTGAVADVWRKATQPCHLSALAAIVCAIIATSPSAHSAAPRGDACAGSPPEAVLHLPQPLSEWGIVVCTPYGHVIAAREGWIWSQPGAFKPVFIPSQMVRRSPASVGNAIYFKAISMIKVDGEDARAPVEAFRSMFPKDPLPASTYRLDVTSSTGSTLRLFFLVESGIWGIWCNTECEASSAFMLLSPKAKQPN
jgi:hypothetical protein